MPAIDQDLRGTDDDFERPGESEEGRQLLELK